MALLKKIRSATLIEALVATVLIVVIFLVASLILNNLLLNSFSRKTHSVETRINELEYKIRYNQITLPYYEEYGAWNIEFEKVSRDNALWLKSSAINKDNGKEIAKNRIYATN